MPGKHQAGDRQRLYSIVIHDVIPTAKQTLNEQLTIWKTNWFLVADEEYNHQDGHYIHIFIKYIEPVSWKRVLKRLQDMKLGSRVHIRYGKSEFNACHKYLTDPGKDKKLDSNVIVNVTRLTLAEKYPQESSKCGECGVLFYNPSPFINGKYTGMFRADTCLKCGNGSKSFREYLKKISQESINAVCSQEASDYHLQEDSREA